jgi:hypothetical protein
MMMVQLRMWLYLRTHGDKDMIQRLNENSKHAAMDGSSLKFVCVLTNQSASVNWTSFSEKKSE